MMNCIFMSNCKDDAMRFMVLMILTKAIYQI